LFILNARPGRHVIHHGSSLCCRRLFGEKIHRDCEITNSFHKAGAAKFISREAKSLGLKIHLETPVLAKGRAQGDAKVGIKCHRTRQCARRRKVAAEVFRNQTADEHKVAMP
jgi:hypothetical protein